VNESTVADIVVSSKDIKKITLSQLTVSPNKVHEKSFRIRHGDKVGAVSYVKLPFSDKIHERTI